MTVDAVGVCVVEHFILTPFCGGLETCGKHNNNNRTENGRKGEK